MSRSWRIVLFSLVLVLVILLIGPFLIPVPPLEGTLPVDQLADPDSRFIEVNDLQVHYKMAGKGEPVFILLHGFGASVFSWREVMQPLGELGTAIAFDRPAFGLTERPLKWSGTNPYSPEAQVDLVIGLMDALGIDRAILVGNSAGGTVAMLTALEHPERVKALILISPAVYNGGGAPAWIRPILNTPQMRHVGPLIARRIQGWGRDFARSAWHNPALITDEIWEGYTRPLKAENWDRALWELTAASRSSGLPNRLDAIQQPTLVVTGDDDRIVPTQDSVRLGSELPNAELVVVPACGHIAHEECPDAFMQAVTDFLAGLP